MILGHADGTEERPINRAAIDTDTLAQASAHASAPMSGSTSRIELIIGMEGRQLWVWEQKPRC